MSVPFTFNREMLKHRLRLYVDRWPESRFRQAILERVQSNAESDDTDAYFEDKRARQFNMLGRKVAGRLTRSTSALTLVRVCP